MDRFCLLAAFLVVECIVSVHSITWKFGRDSQQLLVIAQRSGTILPLHKFTQVSLSVPSCMLIKYVLVEVYNDISTPAVTYNKDTSTVTIHYHLLTSTYSRYDIMAKGMKNPECGGRGSGRGPGGGGGGRFPAGGGGAGRYPGGGNGHHPGGGGGRYPGGGGGRHPGGSGDRNPGGGGSHYPGGGGGDRDHNYNHNSGGGGRHQLSGGSGGGGRLKLSGGGRHYKSGGKGGGSGRNIRNKINGGRIPKFKYLEDYDLEDIYYEPEELSWLRKQNHPREKSLKRLELKINTG